jgi:hypothetical protein
MGQKSGPVKEPAEQIVKQIRRATRRQFSAEEKIRIVLSGPRGEDSIAELCRREGIVDRARTNLWRHAVMSLRPRIFIIATQRSLRSPIGMLSPRRMASAMASTSNGFDDHRLSEFPCTTGKRGQYQDLRIICGLRGDIFLRDQVHAVPQ